MLADFPARPTRLQAAAPALFAASQTRAKAASFSPHAYLSFSWPRLVLRYVAKLVRLSAMYICHPPSHPITRACLSARQSCPCRGGGERGAEEAAARTCRRGERWNCRRGPRPGPAAAAGAQGHVSGRGKRWQQVLEPPRSRPRKPFGTRRTRGPLRGPLKCAR